MTETPGSIDRRAPKPGEHNEEVYGRLLGLRGWSNQHREDGGNLWKGIWLVRGHITLFR
jgi:hypothetical protein